MINPLRFKNKIIAKSASHLNFISKRLIDGFMPEKTEGVPWTPIVKPLSESQVAVVTTAGVHHRDQPPFNMTDPDGDPSFRELIPYRSDINLIITHDYYDHSDADKDINVVFPIQRLWEFEDERIIGKIAERHYGFMGHIIGDHIQTLTKQSAPEVSNRLRKDDVDIVLLTPG